MTIHTVMLGMTHDPQIDELISKAAGCNHAASYISLVCCMSFLQAPQLCSALEELQVQLSE